jgi:hypothetical protein
MKSRSTTPKPEFQFGDAQQGSPSTVNAVAKLDAYIVSYNDGQGKPQARIVFRVPGADNTFMLQERISGSFVATSAHDWFHKALVGKLQEKGLEGKAPEVVESV